MKELMKAFQFAKYGLAFKMQRVIGILFFLLGIVYEIISKGTSEMGGFYCVISGMMLTQSIISVDLSTMVQSSPYKKKLQTSLPTLVSLIVMMATFSVWLIIHEVLMQTSADAAVRERQIAVFYIVVILGFLVQLYMGLAFKFFLAAIFVFLVLVCGYSGLPSENIQWGSLPPWSKSLWGPAVSGYLVFLLGSAGQYGISLLFYKKKLNEYMFRSALKRAAK